MTRELAALIAADWGAFLALLVELVTPRLAGQVVADYSTSPTTSLGSRLDIGHSRTIREGVK